MIPVRTRDVLLSTERDQLNAFLDSHRQALRAALHGLSETEVRTRLVSSQTTLLGLLKHAIYVERIWFTHALTGVPREELSLPETPTESFVLDASDTTTSVGAAHLQACEEARASMGGYQLDDVVTGHRWGPMTVRWIYLHVLRELAEHCGHADILREQLLDRRDGGGSQSLSVRR